MGVIVTSDDVTVAQQANKPSMQSFSGEDQYSLLSLKSPLASAVDNRDQAGLAQDTLPENPPAPMGMPSGATTISQAFYPGAKFSEHPQDTFLISTDKVAFSVASVVLDQASDNHFAMLLSSKNQVVSVPESAQVLNVILHALYHLPLANPPLESIVAALDRFPTYGIDPKAFVLPSEPLYTLLSTYAVLSPMDIYILAASHHFHDLAVSTSAHLLSFPLTELTNDLCDRIGPIYMKRLVQLHFQRIEELKSLLEIAPHPHLETPSCNFEDQRSVTRLWNLASTDLLLDASPDMSTDHIRSTLHSVTDELSCKDCKKAVFVHVKDIVVKWSLVKRTI